MVSGCSVRLSFFIQNRTLSVTNIAIKAYFTSKICIREAVELSLAFK